MGDEILKGKMVRRTARVHIKFYSEYMKA